MRKPSRRFHFGVALFNYLHPVYKKTVECLTSPMSLPSDILLPLTGNQRNTYWVWVRFLYLMKYLEWKLAGPICAWKDFLTNEKNKYQIWNPHSNFFRSLGMAIKNSIHVTKCTVLQNALKNLYSKLGNYISATVRLIWDSHVGCTPLNRTIKLSQINCFIVFSVNL